MSGTTASEVKLKYVATLNDESLSEETDPDYEILYIDIGNVDSSGRIGDIASYRFEEAPSRARRRVRDGDVIISTVRTYLQAIAQVREPPQNVIASTGFAVVRPRRERLATEYCRYALREPSFLAEVERRSVGVSYPAINVSDFASIPVQVHSLPRQRGIADYLDHETARIDALIAAKERLLALLAEKRRALITSAVTRGLDASVRLRDSGVPWLGKIPAHWATVRLRFLSTRIEQGWSPQAENREPGLHEWGVLKLNAVCQGHFDDSAAKALPPEIEPLTNFEVHQGDFLVTRSNTPTSVGDACFVNGTRARLMLSDLIYRLTLRDDAVDGRFLAHYLTLPVGRSQIEMDARGTSASMVKISQDHIKNWLVPVPPIREQQALVDHLADEVEAIEIVRTTTKNTVSILRERRSALIAAAVTGQLDVGEAA